MEKSEYKEIIEGLATSKVYLETMHEDIKEIKADVKKQNGRVRKLEECKVDKDDFKPIRRNVYMILGGLILANLLIPIVLRFIN